MASFDAFLPMLLRFEGGFVDNPADPGGATNKGVTMRTFGSAAVPLLGIQPTTDNLRRLTDEQAGVIYKQLYWDKAQADAIELQALANIVVDFYVNAGAHAITLLQQVLNEAGASPALAVNGVMDAATSAALRRRDPHDIYQRYRQGRIAYYQGLVAQRPQLQCFLRGWINRVNAFPAP
jgi:lysozyme family protein